MSIQIGSIRLKNRVLLAPMSGVTDEAFRKIAAHCGAGLVVSEMVASEELVRSRPDMVRRARGHKRISPFVIQLAGREGRWMAEGAKLAEDLGADIIDINMGCPARQVTGGLSGSALMRDPCQALSIIEATVGATRRPVTLKMRLGWDHASLNAAEIALRAQNAGVQMITVHGRTRCQFYSGRADWAAIRAVKDAIAIPLVANGDGETAADAQEMRRQSGADAVMVGRACYGRPWWAGAIAEELEPGSGERAPDLEEQRDLALWHHEETLSLYGQSLGNKVFRKHFGWLIDRLKQAGLLDLVGVAEWRRRGLSNRDNNAVRQILSSMFASILDTDPNTRAI
jgi:tRNA-dihydrouridine synthase B